METSFPALAILNFIAAFNSLALSALLLGKKSLRTLPGKNLALLLISMSGVLILFTLEDNGWLETSRGIRIFYDTLALLLPAFLLNYVRTSLLLKPVGFFGFFPAVLFFILALVPGTLFLNFLSINHIIFVNIAFTIIAIFTYVGWRKRGEALSSDKKRLRHIAIILGAFVIFHVMQILRMLAPENEIVFALVPLAGAAFLFFIFFYTLINSSVLLYYSASLKGKETYSVQIHAGELEKIMREEKLYLHSDLKLEEVSGRLGVLPKELSFFLNEKMGVNFHAFVNSFRLEEARDLLLSEREIRTSIEAIGLMSGFQSRSAFYVAFNEKFKTSPAEYRKACKK